MLLRQTESRMPCPAPLDLPAHEGIPARLDRKQSAVVCETQQRFGHWLTPSLL
jgi:hypothetical protein